MTMLDEELDEIEFDPELVMPFNAVTHQQYKGGNIMRLLASEDEHGFTNGLGWAGYDQWQTIGRQVRKGEHGTTGFKVVPGRETPDGERRRSSMGGFRVFHFDQTDAVA